jgi:predicted dithiol-disulfide oxidoreductase (DUF899 family)
MGFDDRTAEEAAAMSDHPIVSATEWLDARKALLAKEKEFTRARDALSQERRELPWMRVDKAYVFDGPGGKETLPELFDGRSQLVVYHFMFDPSWDAGCRHCSFWADNFDRIIVHLNQRDVSMVAVSRAPYPKLAAYEKRMGWSFPWLSSSGTDFNYDFRVAFTPEEIAAKKGDYNFVVQDPGDTEREGVSVFFKDPSGQVFRTYSAYARGIDMLNAAYHYLDIVPKGRDEGTRGPFWVRRHDEYGK